MKLTRWQFRRVISLWNSFVFLGLFFLIPFALLCSLMGLPFKTVITIGLICLLLPQFLPSFCYFGLAIIGATEIPDKNLGTKRAKINELRWENKKLEIKIYKYNLGFPNVMCVGGRHKLIAICVHEDLFHRMTDQEFFAAIQYFIYRKSLNRSFFENFNILFLSLIGAFLSRSVKRNPFSFIGPYVDVFLRILIKPLIDLARDLTTDKYAVSEAESSVSSNSRFSSSFLSLRSKIKAMMGEEVMGISDLQGFAQISFVNPVVELEIFDLGTPKANQARLNANFWESLRSKT